MEKSIDTAALPIFSAIRETFDIRKGDIRTYSPLTLAYIGDGIYDLVIRSMIVAQGNTKASQLHQHTSHLVKAHSQSAMMEYLLPVLSEEEEAVYKRGRNAKWDICIWQTGLTGFWSLRFWDWTVWRKKKNCISIIRNLFRNLTEV